MNIIATDDEQLALISLTKAIEAAIPDAAVTSFRKAKDVLAFAQDHPIDVAFLDIQMRGMSGIELAKRLKTIHPKANIVFVTGYDQYMGNAISLRASGYVLKPATKEKILEEIDNLRYPLPIAPEHRLRVQCFGNFEVFVDGNPLHFPHANAKALLALLIDRRGAGLTTPEIAAILWENEPYSANVRTRVQKAIAHLRYTLKKAGCEDLLHKEHNHTAINTDGVYCDYLEFLSGNLQAINSFTGEYMTQYSWAEFTTAFLTSVK